MSTQEQADKFKREFTKLMNRAGNQCNKARPILGRPKLTYQELEAGYLWIGLAKESLDGALDQLKALMRLRQAADAARKGPGA
jgi:hypothetical protein